MSIVVGLASLGGGLAACDAESPGDPVTIDASYGKRVYETPLADGNSFTCATCHAIAEPADDGLRRPGHPIGDATRRSSWKNGKAPTFLDAVNACVTDWMVAPAWSSSDARFVGLQMFLEAQTHVEHAPNLTFKIVDPPADLAGGDAARGRTTFNESCVVCHGKDAVGTTRGPRIAASKRTAEYIGSRIRTSGPKTSGVYKSLTGGVMPFWAEDRLEDDEIRDIVAFLHAAKPSTDGGAPLDASADANDAHVEASEGNDAAPTGCTKNNPRVGWKADLGVNTGEGQVSGFVTMVDDCTLRLTNFSYDGNGIDVRVYGSKSSTFNPGIIVGDNIVGQVFDHDTLDVTLPSGTTLNDLDWVAIWCVDAKANFGSGPFKTP